MKTRSCRCRCCCRCHQRKSWSRCCLMMSHWRSCLRLHCCRWHLLIWEGQHNAKTWVTCGISRPHGSTCYVFRVFTVKSCCKQTKMKIFSCWCESVTIRPNMLYIPQHRLWINNYFLLQWLHINKSNAEHINFLCFYIYFGFMLLNMLKEKTELLWIESEQNIQRRNRSCLSKDRFNSNWTWCTFLLWKSEKQTFRNCFPKCEIIWNLQQLE